MQYKPKDSSVKPQKTNGLLRADMYGKCEQEYLTLDK
jgi:hypothetical protein